MAKPTYKDLEEKVKVLEAELGIQNKPTKMQEIETVETETMVKVKDLVRNCEAITGRTLKECSTESGFSLDVRNSNTPLRSMIAEMMDLALDSGMYTFDNTRCFADWVHKKIMEG